MATKLSWNQEKFLIGLAKKGPGIMLQFPNAIRTAACLQRRGLVKAGRHTDGSYYWLSIALTEAGEAAVKDLIRSN